MSHYLTVIHECEDFAVGRKGYDADLPRREAAGLTDLSVLRLDEDANNLALFWGVSDVARATAFFDSPERHFWKA
jgi:hypothetical protein